MNNINKVKPLIVRYLFILLQDKDIYEIAIKDLCEIAHISRASFYRNFSSVIEVLYYYFDTVFISTKKIIDDKPLSTGIIINELLSSIYYHKEEFSILAKRNCITYLGIYFQNYTNPAYFANMFRREAFIGVSVAIINAWINDGYQREITEMIQMLKKTFIFNDNLINIPKNTQVVLSTKTMRESDQNTINSGVNSKELMYKAGLAVYQNYHYEGKILIVAGKGNNAGDGFVLAALLKENNKDVAILLLDQKMSEDGQFYFNICQGKKVPTYTLLDNIDFNNYDILVDCIFGTGFKGEVNEPFKSTIIKMNEARGKIVSVDINSGLSGDSGLAYTAIKSDLTISIGSLKTGLYLNQAKDYIKLIKNVDIGIKPVHEDYYLLGSDDVKLTLRKRDNFTNKGSYGYVALIGGSDLYSGAVKLSNLALSSLKMGAGVSLLCAIKSIKPYILPYMVESTFYPLDEKDGGICFNPSEMDYLIKRCKTITIGMGLGQSEDVIKTVRYLLENYQGNLIIDADGLNALSKIDESVMASSKAKIILTPHIKEFSRLSGYTISEIQNDSLSIVEKYALKHHIIVLLKGTTTIISDGQKTYLVNRGCPGMAVAGSGDVLSGLLTGIVSYNEDNLLLAVASGAFINGLAGELAELYNTDISMTSLDTAKYISDAIKIIREN